jgi:hypothetical protein
LVVALEECIGVAETSVWLVIPSMEFSSTLLLMELLVASYKLVGSHTVADTSSSEEGEGSTVEVDAYSTMEPLAGSIVACEPS